MQRYTISYYFLIVLLITGAFASMAQNDYGTAILFSVALGFCLLFSLQLFTVFFREKERRISDTSELVGLVILSGTMAMRTVFLRFEFVEIIFGAAGLILIFVYATRMKDSYHQLQSKSFYLVAIILIYYGSIILYILSMVVIPFAPQMLTLFGVSGFFLLLIFVAFSVQKKVVIDSELITPMKFILRFRDHSMLLIILFFLFTVYSALTDANFLPKLYSNEYPQVYFDLVNRAEMGKEKSVNGKFQHDEYMQAYDHFVKRNIQAENK